MSPAAVIETKKLADDSVIIRLLEGKELDHFKSEKT